MSKQGVKLSIARVQGTGVNDAYCISSQRTTSVSKEYFDKLFGVVARVTLWACTHVHVQIIIAGFELSGSLQDFCFLFLMVLLPFPSTLLMPIAWLSQPKCLLSKRLKNVDLNGRLSGVSDISICPVEELGPSVEWLEDCVWKRAWRERLQCLAIQLHRATQYLQSKHPGSTSTITYIILNNPKLFLF